MALKVWDDNLADTDIGKEQKASDRITEVTTTPGPYYGTKITRGRCETTDTEVAGSGTRMRCEVKIKKEALNIQDGTEDWWAWTYVGESGSTPTGNDGFRKQWHAPVGKTQAQVAYNTPSGKWNVRLWDAGTGQQTNHPIVDSNGVQRVFANGTPIHVIERIIHSTKADVGLYEAWCNGVKFVSRRMQFTYTKDSAGNPITDTRNAPKWGIYTDVKTSQIVWRVDGLRRATAAADMNLETMAAGFPAGSGYEGITSTPAVPVLNFLSPGAGATVSGVTAWYAEASDPAGLSKVEFLVDGAIVLSEINAPYGDTPNHWDTRNFAEGAHTLTLKSYKTNGTPSLSVDRTVTIDNVTATTPPAPVANLVWFKTAILSRAGSKITRTKVSHDGKVTVEEQS